MSESQSEFLVDLKRTHDCGGLRASDAGSRAILFGWVAARRDHGGCVFIDLRDRGGTTQVVFEPQTNAEAHGKAQVSLRFTAETALRQVLGTTTHARVLGDTTALELAVESALAALVPERVVSILGARIRRRRLVRRMPRPRFRGFGDRGREVAMALRDVATRPRVSDSASGRRH